MASLQTKRQKSAHSNSHWHGDRRVKGKWEKRQISKTLRRLAKIRKENNG